MVAPDEIQNSGMCSTSGSTHVSINGCLASSLVDSSKDHRCRRWRGRRQCVEAKDYVETLRGSTSDANELKKGEETNDTEVSAILTDTKMVWFLNMDLNMPMLSMFHKFLFCKILWQSLVC